MKLAEEKKTGCPLLIYGPPGIGKSTLASLAPKPIFIDVENGLRRLKVAKTPVVGEFEELIGHLRDFFKSDYQTVIIDTLDILETKLHKYVCRKNNWMSIEQPGYGNGYTAAQEEWSKLLDIFDKIIENERNVILIAHEQIRTYQNPEQDSFDRFSIKLNAKSANLIAGKMDAILFCTQELIMKTDRTDEDRIRAITTGKRIFRTIDTAACMAKNRFNLNAIEPMDASIFKKLKFVGAE